MNFQNSISLLDKAIEARQQGSDGFNECIANLDASISMMGEVSTKDVNNCGPASHVLARAYCLRAFYKQDKEPESKSFVEDIDVALELWLTKEHKQISEQNPLVSKNSFKLLYHVCNLLLFKDCMEDHHSHIYENMIGFCKWVTYPLEECLLMLWQSKSLNDALCTSPVNDVSLQSFSKHCSMVDSMDV